MTMDLGGLAQSPQTQMMGSGGQGPVSVDDAFTEGFSQMAYDAMEKANPSLMKDVITFRVLDVNPEEGSGLGTFILAVNQEVFYVPVVVANNNVKPINKFYSRRLDRYFPLTHEWIEEANKSSLSQLGQGVDPPKTLQSDVDIRNVTVPPMQGRYSFANDWRGEVAARAHRGMLDQDASFAFKSAASYDPNQKKAQYLPSILAALPNRAKVAFANVLRRRPSVFRKMANLYTVKSVQEALALREEKVAQTEERPMKHDLFVGTAGMPVESFRKAVGDKTPKAYGIARSNGIYVSDKRKGTQSALLVDPQEINLTQPKESGLYNVFLTDGTTEEALVLTRPHESDMNVCCWGGGGLSKLNAKPDQLAPDCLVLFKDGRMIRTTAKFVAEPILMANRGELAAIVHKWTNDTPAAKQRGVLISALRGQPRAVGPVEFDRVSSVNDETRCVSAFGPSVTISRRMAAGSLVKAMGGSSIAVSDDFRWFKLNDETRSMRAAELLVSPREVLASIEAKLVASGSKKVEVKTASGGRFIVGYNTSPLRFHEAVEKIATQYNLSIPAVIEVMKTAALDLPGTIWTKKADAPPPQQDPNAPPMDPSMGMGMGMPMPPPPPDGYELAIAEQLQLIQNQVAALNDKATTLSMLQQRKIQIDGGGGAMVAPTGAAALMAGAPQGPMGGPAMAPPSADPSTMGMPPGGAAPPPGMPPAGGDPSMGGMPPGGMPPGGDPSMGGMPPGGDPSMGGMPPAPPSRAVMTNASLDAGDVENSINPDFLDQAGSLEQSDVFDAAAIASLAQNKNLRTVVQSHLPRAEETLDRIGRMSLLFDLKESKLKQSIGNDAYNEITQNLEDVFNQLGELLLKLTESSDQLAPALVR